MMLDFPASPTTGQIYNGTNGVTYRWNGAFWVAVGASPGGDFYATMGYPAPNVGGTFTTMGPPVVTGNAGGWYVPGTGRYTPPAGRYFLHADVSGNSSTASLGNLGVQLRKNGVVVQDNYGMTGYGYYADPGVDAVLDANGSDWFDAQYESSPASTVIESITFLAYPISGIKGPPGDPPTAQSIMLYRSVSTAGVPTVSAQIAWDVVAYNTTGGTPSGGGFTVPGNMGGVWDVQVLVNGAHTSTSGNVGVDLYVNGVKTASSTGFCSTGGGAAIISGKFALAAGSVVTTQMYGSANMVYYGTGGGGERYSWMHLTRVGT